MNKAILIGRLTADPEPRATSGGTAVATFTLAVNRRFADANGNRTADFIPVVAWRQLADLCVRYLHKGDQAGVSGSIQTRSYDARDGSKRYVTEIIADEVDFLQKKSAADPMQGFAQVDDDDLPF